MIVIYYFKLFEDVEGVSRWFLQLDVGVDPVVSDQTIDLLQYHIFKLILAPVRLQSLLLAIDLEVVYILERHLLLSLLLGIVDQELLACRHFLDIDLITVDVGVKDLIIEKVKQLFVIASVLLNHDDFLVLCFSHVYREVHV